MTPTPRAWISGLAACGFFALSGPWTGSWAEAARPGEAPGFVEAATSGATVAGAEPADRAPAATAAPMERRGAAHDLPGGDTAERPGSVADAREAELRADARVQGFIRAYGPLIDSVTYRDEDLVFTLGGRAIHFQDGRMLLEDRLDRRHRCDPIFYRYPLTLPTEPAAPSGEVVRLCTDLQEALWGRTEAQIRRHARSTTFLDRRMFLNELVVQALARVERDILVIAATAPDVAEWIEEMDITYSFIDRGIAGTSTRSQHAWGLAVDLVPSSYEGRQVYWRWTRAWKKDGWHRVPLEQRWSPPAAVVETFERHGFVWGGKWARFDNIHFEYRPEILEYNRLMEAAGA